MTTATLRIEVSIGRQVLRLLEPGAPVREYPISTARNGPGEQMDSECTPRGLHEICEKIGAESPENAVFIGRRPTGEIYTPALRAQFPGRDWILTRILWLAGLEPGRNQGGMVDSRWRFIYLHGTPDDVSLGTPGSRGCIRMRNTDIVDLFDRVSVGTLVSITDDRSECV